MALDAPVPRPGILDIDLYVPGLSSVPGGMKPIKLSSNETPLGPSAKALEAYRAEAAHLERYPDGPPPRCARRSPAATASTPTVSSAAAARTSY